MPLVQGFNDFQVLGLGLINIKQVNSPPSSMRVMIGNDSSQATTLMLIRLPGSHRKVCLHGPLLKSLAAYEYGSERVAQMAYPWSIAFGEPNDDRHVGNFGVPQGFLCLWHDSVISCHHHHCLRTIMRKMPIMQLPRASLLQTKACWDCQPQKPWCRLVSLHAAPYHEEYMYMSCQGNSTQTAQLLTAMWLLPRAFQGP